MRQGQVVNIWLLCSLLWKSFVALHSQKRGLCGCSAGVEYTTSTKSRPSGIHIIHIKRIMPDQTFSEMLGILEIFYLKKCFMSYKEQDLTFCIEFFFTSRYSVVRIIMRTFQTKASNFCSLHKFHFDHH